MGERSSFIGSGLGRRSGGVGLLGGFCFLFEFLVAKFGGCLEKGVLCGFELIDGIGTSVIQFGQFLQIAIERKSGSAWATDIH